jgi:RNA polymerase sigma-70 factor, ECF subfamily
VREGRPRQVDRAEHARALGAFVTACATGDLATLEQLLAADVVCHSDHGGRARAARNQVRGSERVARMMVGLTRKNAVLAHYEARELNGLPALVALEDGVIVTAVLFDVVDGKIDQLYIVRNPDKLQRAGALPA